MPPTTRRRKASSAEGSPVLIASPAKKVKSAAPKGMSELERQRLENIRRNEELMRSLGLDTAVSSLMDVMPAPAPPKPKPKSAKPKSKTYETQVVTRRSTRLAKMEPLDLSEEGALKRMQEEMELKEAQEKAKRARIEGPIPILVIDESSDESDEEEAEEETRTKEEETTPSEEERENTPLSERLMNGKKEAKDAGEAVKKEITGAITTGTATITAGIFRFKIGAKTKKFMSLMAELETGHGVKKEKVSSMTSSSLATTSKHAQYIKELRDTFSKLHIRFDDGSVKVTQERIYSASFHPSSDKLLAAAGDKSGMLGFWNCTNTLENPHTQEHEVYKFQPHRRPISVLRFLPNDYSKLYTVSYDASIRIMDINAGVFQDSFVHPEETWITSMDFHPSTPTNLWISDGYGNVCFHDTRTKQSSSNSVFTSTAYSPERVETQLYSLSERKISCLAIHPTLQHYLLISGLDQQSHIFDIRNFKSSRTSNEQTPLVSFEGHGKAVTSAHWTTDGSSFVTLGYDDTIRTWLDVVDVNKGLVKKNPKPSVKVVKHNNQTGRWVTNFRALVHTNPSRQVYYVGNMTRGIDIYSYLGDHIVQLADNTKLTAVPAVIHAHPEIDAFVGGNASGRMTLFS